MGSPEKLTSMTVSLPASQKDYVKAQAIASGCSTPSEFIRRLIHADQKAHQDQELERLILEGLASPAREIGDAEWSALRADLRRKLSGRRKTR